MAKAPAAQLHAGPRFVNDFDMFEIQQGYLRIVFERGFRLPPRYLEFAGPVERIRAALAVRPQPTVPCHNDLLAANIMDAGDRLWFIDYEYAGNNDPCFELGNIWSEANLAPDALVDLVDSLLRAAFTEFDRAGASTRADVEVRVDAVGVDPGRHQFRGVRLLELGLGEVRTGGGRIRRPRVRQC